MNPIHNTRPCGCDPYGLFVISRLLRSAVVCSLSLLVAFAQNATSSVTGRVSNAATGAYLDNAEIRIVGTERVTTTVQGGYYLFSNVPAGVVRISAAYTGLDPVEQQVTVPAAGPVTLDFNLTSAQYGEVVQLGKFVVSTEREGNAKAIVDQRQAANIKNVISSDAFGSVSEDNVGEFLKYMPGLSINYNENDARTVSVRGMASKYSSVTIDGNPVASADFNMGIGREFQFEQVSLSTIDSIEVNKTPLADQPANSLAGTVNVASKSALNQKGRRIKYGANFTLNEYAMTLSKTMGWNNKEHYKALPGGSLEFSDTFMAGRLGIIAAISHTGTYVEQKIIANLGRVFDNVATNNDTEIPRINQVNWQDGLKPTFRDSILVNVDFKATPDMILSFRTSYNMYDAPFHNRNWTFAANTATLSNLTATSVTTTATSATETGNTATVAGTNYRKYGATFSVNPAIKWKINPNMTFDGSLSYSRSYQWYDSDAEGFFNIVSARMTGLSWGYTSDSESPALQFTQYRTAASNTGSFFDIANYNNNNTAQTANRDAKDQYWTAKADLTIKVPQWRLPTVFKVGFDNRIMVKDNETWTKVWSMNVNPTVPGYINLANYKDTYTPDFAKGEKLTDLNGVVGTAPSLDKWRLYELFTTFNTNPYSISTAAQQPFFLTAAQAAANWRNLLQNKFDFKETIQSAYVMANVKATKNLQVVAGLRFESTESQGRAFDDIGPDAASDASGTTNTNDFNYITARYGRRSLKTQSYDDIFPSMQVRYALRNNLLLRGAYYKSILRPDPVNIARSLVSNDDGVNNPTITTTNPDLKPEYADNFEARIEYYFEPVGVLSAGFFYKKIKDAQLTITTPFTLENVPQDVLDLGYTPEALVARSAQFSRTSNGPENTISGFELEYSQQLSNLPGAFKGLGVFANYTYTHPKDMVLFGLAGNTGNAVSSGIPKHAANAGLSYKYAKFNGSIKLNWVGERVLGLPGYRINTTTNEAELTPGNNTGIWNYERARLKIDLNLEYQLHPKAAFYLNIADMTNSASYRYSMSKALMIRHAEFGAKYTIGVRGSF